MGEWGRVGSFGDWDELGLGEGEMTVKELIELLKVYPEDLQVIYIKYSEQCLLEASELEIVEKCYPRADGWVQDGRPDMPKREYLRFPGN